MDLREIIKWFIPCFHILLKMDARMMLLFLLLLCNLCSGMASSSDLDNTSLNNTKNLVINELNLKFNQSEVFEGSKLDVVDSKSEDTEVGRTFGRPMKKMMQALIPLAVAIGSAGTWAVVAALIGAKTLIIALVILKLLLVAGAAKFGGLFAAKAHHPAPAPGKEIHLHIHNGQHGHHEYEEVIPNLSTWSREGAQLSTVETMTAAQAINPYQYLGPATIRTPYGNYVKIEG